MELNVLQRSEPILLSTLAAISTESERSEGGEGGNESAGILELTFTLWMES